MPPTLQQPVAGAAASNPYNLRKEIVADLKNAYTNAPPFFQRQLCLLDGVYLNPTGCGNGGVNSCNSLASGAIFGSSWGFRSGYPRASDNGRRYIAVSAGLWQPNQPALPFHQFADMQLQALAPWGGAQVQASNPPTPDTSWMTILAAMAHEFGHVRWVDVTVPLRAPPNDPAGGPPDFNLLHNCLLPDGSNFDFFLGWSYRNDNELFPKGGWRHFNDRQSEANHPIDHISAPLISQFSAGSADKNNDLFYELFQNNNDAPDGPWASYFGSRAPDEDFVESYVLGVLTANTSGVAYSLPVTLVYSNGSMKTVDVPKTLSSRAILQNKMSCIPP
jgi:hypothetical protein